MKVHSGVENWPRDIGRTVTTLGNFDGVHMGHQLILKTVVDAAARQKLPSVVVTFDPVPRKVLNPRNAPPLIQTLEQRLRSLSELNIDHTIVVVFNSEFAKKSPEEFVQQCLVDRLHVRKFVVGENFAFGHQKSGNVDLLQRLGK